MVMELGELSFTLVLFQPPMIPEPAAVRVYVIMLSKLSPFGLVPFDSMVIVFPSDDGVQVLVRSSAPCSLTVTVYDPSAFFRKVRSEPVGVVNELPSGLKV